MATRTIGTIASAQSRPEKPSGVPLRLQWVATVGGSCGYAQTDMARASAAITRPNQRLRMVLSSAEAGHEVADDLLKHGRVQPIPDELAFTLGGNEVRTLQHAEVVRYRRERDRELLGDLAGGEIPLGQELEDLPSRRIGQGAEQCVVHWHRHLYHCLNNFKEGD